LAGFAYVIDSGKFDEEYDDLFSSEFCTYLPASDIYTGCDFDFIGRVIEYKSLKYQKEKMLLLDVELINGDELSFILPMVVNQRNIRIDSVKKGSFISGRFWLQGKIFN